MRGLQMLVQTTVLCALSAGAADALASITYLEQRAGLFGETLPLTSVNMVISPYYFLSNEPTFYQEDVSQGTRVTDLRSDGFSLTCSVFASRTVTPSYTSEWQAGLGALGGVFLRFAVASDTWVQIERTRLDEHSSDRPGDTDFPGRLGTFGFQRQGGPNIESLQPLLAADPVTALLPAGTYEVFMGMWSSGVGFHGFDFVHSETYRLNYSYALTIVPSPASACGLLTIACVWVRRRRAVA